MDYDRKATYERLYTEHARAVFSYCLRRTSTEEAKDAMADVFVVAWRRFDDIPDPDNALPWLFGVARNVLAHRSRTARRRQRLAAKAAVTHEHSVPSPEGQVVRSAEHEAVVAALQKLPERDREVIRLVEWEGLSRDTVADMMFVSRSAIDKRMARAYKKLARHLGVSDPIVRTSPVPIEEGGEA